MSFNENKKRDYNSLSSSKKNDDKKQHAQSSLKPSKKSKKQNGKETDFDAKNLVNYSKEQEQKLTPHYTADNKEMPHNAEDSVLKPKKSALEREEKHAEIENKNGNKKSLDGNKEINKVSVPKVEENRTERLKREKKEKQEKKDFDMLTNESWVVRNGHYLTYLGLYCFSILVFFRPYELIPGLGFLKATAFYFAAVTLFVYLPTQLATEENLTMLSTEVKCVLVLTGVAIIMMPFAKDFGMAWEKFNDSFIKAVAMFIVMVNVLRTRKRLMGIVWLSLSIGVVLSYMALSMYIRGEISVEGYRVAVEVGGMFGNPNELALHLVMMTPIAIALGMAAKTTLMKSVYFIAAGLFVAGNVVTYSRGGFLGLMAVAAVLIWKLGKKQRIKIFAVSAVFFVLFIALAPGEYGKRIFSIFDSSLDSVGSSSQRTDLLKRSILVSIRNPWGIGIGNFPIVGQQNLGTHNAFTEVSSELGVVGFLAYVLFLVSPFRKLAAIERRLLAKDETKWFYYLAVGLQASIVGYMVSSFFAAVAYNWFAYYLIAYAVAFRRIYTIEKGIKEEEIQTGSLSENLFGWQIKST